MKGYYRVMLGSGSKYAKECHKGNFIGVDYGMDVDFEGKLSENWRDFNKKFIPYYLEKHPENKSKVAAGLACGTIWTLAKGIEENDIVLCPDGENSYFVGVVVGGYSYHPDDILPHRREVRWYDFKIKRGDMSEGLCNSTGSINALSDIAKHSDEIERFIGGHRTPTIVSTDKSVEDPASFVMEAHLEDFLIQNWGQTEIGKKYDIFEVDGEIVGRQYPSDTGPIDILAISKDKKELLVVELKKGKASDAVVGQIQRYMGFVLEELAEEGQAIKGIIIAAEDDSRIKRALKVTRNIDFYRYQVNFKLLPI